MGKVIDFPGANTATPEEKPTPPTEREKKLKGQLSLLPQYRGEVVSKNNIRLLPNLKRGEIFWVNMDHAAFCVAAVDLDKKGHTRVVIKKLDETATISTGMTIFDLNKGIVAKEKLFDWEDRDKVDELCEKFATWFSEVENKFYLLYGRDIHYVTLFDNHGTNDKSTFALLFKGLLSEVGDIISIDFDTMEGERCVEVWVRTPNSPAELLYLMPYDKGVVTI